MNIWSHLIGFFCAIYSVIDFIIDHVLTPVYSSEIKPPSFDSLGVLCFGIFIVSAAICLLFSTIYHWFNCLSPGHHNTLLLLDLTGIALLVGSSYFPAIYFGFYCHTDIQRVYIGLSVVILAVGLVAPWIDVKIKGVGVRPFIFASLVATGVVPALHWCALSPRLFRDEVALGEKLLFSIP
ncbi:unnamed protein product [Sphagnum jensenii]